MGILLIKEDISNMRVILKEDFVKIPDGKCTIKQSTIH